MWKIYKHTLLVDCEQKGWSYIGQTCQKLYKRWQNGKGYCDGRNTLFEKAIKQYGWNSFSHEILEDNIPSKEIANEREAYWIKYYNTCVEFPNSQGYNLTSGGEYYKMKKIVCLETGQVFNSITEAFKQTGMSQCQISKQLNNKNIKNSNCRAIRKYHWAELPDNDINLQEFIKVQKEKYYIIECKETKEKFMSIKEAAIKYNIPANNIVHCLSKKSNNKTAGGYHWKKL